MPGIKASEFKLLRELAGFDKPLDVFVETGLFHGNTALAATASGEFTGVHSIEISDKYIREFTTKHPLCSVTVHHGNSAEVLPLVAPDRPCFFLLDAHWWNDPVDPIDCPKEGLPLFKELDYVLSRPYAEMVIIDDTFVFGGGEHVSAEWKEVTVDKLNERIGARRRFSFIHDLRYVVGLKEAA